MDMSTSSSATASPPAVAMNMDDSCKISMLWNWYTIDACFLSRTWRVTSTAAFAGTCIGVILLVMTLESLRRLQREFDRLTKRQDQKKATRLASANPDREDAEGLQYDQDMPIAKFRSVRRHISRKTMIQRQLLRATMHMLHFALAYFIMLLAMYYNGYIIICIIIGAFLGSFMFSWDELGWGPEGESADVTGCCG